jgi:hypothetical protein
MLVKCKICGKLPPEDFRQVKDGIIVDEPIYFFIIDGKTIFFCSPHCAMAFATKTFYAVAK